MTLLVEATARALAVAGSYMCMCMYLTDMCMCMYLTGNCSLSYALRVPFFFFLVLVFSKRAS